jgi:hypothetical protein
MMWQLPLVQNVQQHWAEYLVGVFFVASHAYARFNTPPTQKYSTTWRQYHAALTLYVAVIALGYLLFSYSPALFGLTTLGGLPEPMQNLSPPLLIALILTVLLPRFSKLAQLDRSLREFFWEQASIPAEVHSVKALLKSADYTMPRKVRQRVQDSLQKRGVREPWIDVALHDHSFAPWMKVAAFIEQIELWIEERQYRPYLQTIRVEFVELKAQCEAFFADAMDYMDESDRPPRAGAVLGVRSNRILAKLNKKADVFLDGFYTFFAQAVIHCEASSAARTNKLRELGFEAEYESVPRQPGIFVLVFLLLLTIFFVSFAFLMKGEGRSLAHRLMDSVRISLIYCVAVSCAVFMRRWSDPEGKVASSPNRNPGYYAWTGIYALVLGTGASLIAYRMELPSWPATWWRFGYSWPYLAIYLVVAASVAALIDTRENRLAWLRDAVVLAAASMLTAAFVHEMLNQIDRQVYVTTIKGVRATFSPRDPPSLGALVGVAGIAGFAIGSLVPSWYRPAILKNRCRTSEAKEPPPTKLDNGQGGGLGGGGGEPRIEVLLPYKDERPTKVEDVTSEASVHIER